jgi:hypothetical protein
LHKKSQRDLRKNGTIRGLTQLEHRGVTGTTSREAWVTEEVVFRPRAFLRNRTGAVCAGAAE